jgi:hypothetical protein
VKRRTTIAVILILCVLMGVALVLRAKLQLQTDTAVTYALINDLGSYYRDHRRLPPSWKSFVEWYSHSHSSRWESQDLEASFALNWNATVEMADRESPLLTVIDPRLKRHQSDFNRYLILQAQASE